MWMLLEISLFEWVSVEDKLWSFGCAVFTCSELILKSERKQGMVHHSFGSSSLQETSVFQEESFCDKAQSESMVIKLFNETLK